MLRLPPLEILRDELSEVRLTQQAKAELEKDNALRTEGIHASGLLDPLLTFWRTIQPEEMTEKQIWLFTIGKVLHHIVLTAGSDLPVVGSDSGTHEEQGVFFSPDGEINSFPVELKTNRSPKEPAPSRLQEDYHNYLEQLCIYMVLKNVLVGYLWVLFISLKDERNRTWPEPRCYRVTMTDEQFYDVEQQIFAMRDALKDALDTKNPSALPLCRAWLCGEGTCTYWTRCQPEGRYGRAKRDWSH